MVALSLQLEAEPVKKEKEEPTEGEAKSGDAEMKDEKPTIVEEPAYGKEIMDDLNRAFRGWVEQREWQNVRLCVCFPACDRIGVGHPLIHSCSFNSFLFLLLQGLSQQIRC